jgi:dihydroorotate dehydrogenase (fumarate)
MNLGTHYLGLALRNPLVASASPLSEGVDRVRALADAGVGAVVLYSLFEEEVTREQLREVELTERTEDSFGEALSYLPEPYAVGTPDGVGADSAAPGPVRRYLDLIERSVAVVDIPVIASLNGSTRGGWARFAGSMEDAGAAAIELNIYFVPGDPHTSGREVEDRHLEILHTVKEAVSVPVAVKLSPHFSSPGEMALRLDDAGADGLVLFNRFLQPDVDTESLQVNPGVTLSVPSEARLPRTWIAILRGHVTGSLAATTGVDRAEDVAAYLLAGADVVMTASALLRHGVGHAQVLLDGLESWAERKGFSTLDDVRGRLAVPRDVDPTMHQRAGYVAALGHARRTYGALSSPTAPEVL